MYTSSGRIHEVIIYVKSRMLWIYEWQQSDNVANMDSKGGNYTLGSRPCLCIYACSQSARAIEKNMKKMMVRKGMK